MSNLKNSPSSLLLFSVFFVLSSQANAQKDVTYYIQQAQLHQPVVRDFQNQNKINALETARLRAAFLKPQVSFNANYLFAPIISLDNNRVRPDLNAQSAENYLGLDLAATNGGSYQALFTVTQPLWMTERFKPIAEQFRINNLQNDNTIALANHDVERNVTDQYIACLFDLKQIVYVQNVLKIIDEQAVIVTKLAQAALAKQSDLTLLTIEKQRQLLNLTTFQSNYRRDLLDLNVLCGINDTTIQTLDPLSIKAVSDLISAKKDTISFKFIEKYRLDSLAALSAQQVFEMKYQPQIQAFANGGLSGTYIPDLYKRFGWSAGVNFSIYLFDGNQKALNRDKIALQIQTAAAYRESFMTQNGVRKARILNELQALQDRQTATEKQIVAYQNLLDAYRKELVQGQISVLNLVTVLKDFTALQQDFITIQTQQQLLTNAYNYWNW